MGHPGGARSEALLRARALQGAGRLREAFDAYRQAARAGDRQARAELAWFLVDNRSASPHPDIETALVAALKGAWIRPDLLAPAASGYLAALAGGGFPAPGPEAGPPHGLLADPRLEAVVRSRLWGALLQATTAASPGLDVFVARFRRAALSAFAAGLDLRDWTAPLAAVGVRSARSGFALTLPEGDPWAAGEAEELARLREEVAAGDAGRASAARAALLAAYVPLREIGGSPARWRRHEALSALCDVQLVEPRQEAAIARGLVARTAIDGSNAAVAEQYEAAPYPVWVREPLGLTRELPPAAAAHVRPDEVRRVLVAGCGTGQHALAAAERWPQAEVLGLDVSRTSLAHAIRRSGELKLRRLRFALADLLHVAELDARFEVVEAVGVLHHLEDPGAGLRALAQVLEPGGLLLMGVYARAARARLDEARALMDGARPATAEGIRAFRARALARLDAPEILHAPDFYSVSGCRDLVFHARERAYALPEALDLMTGCGLTPLALEAPDFPGLSVRPEASDFAAWAALEEARPTLFAGMYQIWARAPAA